MRPELHCLGTSTTAKLTSLPWQILALRVLDVLFLQAMYPQLLGPWRWERKTLLCHEYLHHRSQEGLLEMTAEEYYHIDKLATTEHLNCFLTTLRMSLDVAAFRVSNS